jgi:hypothetical protein
MKILDKDMEYEGSEIKVLDVLNRLGRKVYKKKAGAIVSEKRREVHDKLKTLTKDTIRAVMAKDDKDFKIPRLFKMKIKQNNLKLKRELYNLFRGAESPSEFIHDSKEKGGLSQFKIVESTKRTVNELTEIEKTILSKWKLVSETIAELAEPEIKAREKQSKIKLMAQAMKNVLDFKEAIQPARKSVGLLEEEVIVLSERLQKDPVKFLLPSGESATIEANKERIKSDVQRVLRLLKRKQSYIDRVQKEIDKWQSFVDEIEKDLEE